MKKLVYILMAMSFCISCSHKKQHKMPNWKDSMVVVYGFGNHSIDDSVVIPYKELLQYRDSFAPVYDVPTNTVVYMRSKCSCKYGDYKIDKNGDTLFCVETGFEKYVSAKEWHEYYEKFQSTMDSIDRGLK